MSCQRHNAESCRRALEQKLKDQERDSQKVQQPTVNDAVMVQTFYLFIWNLNQIIVLVIFCAGARPAAGYSPSLGTAAEPDQDQAHAGAPTV